ncbi:MAG TPA: DUF1552 domain-containing protein [Kofleriaceae bacterium]
MPKKPLSRRTFLRGAGGAMVALPFLEAMLPKLLFAHAATPKRFVVSFCGTVVGNDTLSSPGAYGALPATMPASWKALEPVRQHVSVISNMNIPVYNSTTPPTQPASAYNMQHGTTPACSLAGVTSIEHMAIMVKAQTADQFAATTLGPGSKLASLQVRTQVLPYTGSNNNHHGIMSAKLVNGALLQLPPIVSPAQLFTTLFGAGGSTPGGTPALERQASVLDLIASDAQRLTSTLGANDKARVDQHFEEIRSLEKSIQAAISGGGSTGTCGPATKPTDPPIGPNAFSGSSNETLRGQMQADMIAYALSCDLTRVASWMMTFEQVQMANAVDGLTQMHDDSHSASTRPVNIAANCNWHATLFARLVQKLAAMPEGTGTVLDNTFLSLIFAESKTAHGRSGMRMLAAGLPSRIRNGQHIDAQGLHPGKIQLSGLQAVGVATNTLGELTGALSPLMV